MNFDEMFPGKYLKASDLGLEPRNARIDSIETEKMGDGEHKPVIYFKGSDRGLVLNKTNGSVLRDLYGADTEDWLGQPIALVAATTDFQGKVVDCIRLRPPAKKKPEPVAESAFADLDDEIPFA